MENDDISIPQEVVDILATAAYQQRARDVGSAVDSCADATVRVSGLDRNQARAMSYYCCSTHIPQEKKRFSPPLTAIGPTSSGKSSAMEVAGHYCCRPKTINAKNQTFPTVRDKVISALKRGVRTVLIEEADRCKHSSDLEEFVFEAYVRTTAEGSVKRLTEVSQGVLFTDCSYDVFVPFISHRRHRYSDVANENRGIEIRFEQKAGKFPKPDTIQLDNGDKMALIADLNLAEAAEPDGVEGRVWDKWRLLIGLALTLGDTNWIQWALDRMKKDSSTLQDGRETEPQVAIFLALVASLDRSFKAIPLTRIKSRLESESDMKLSNRNIKAELRDLGITVKQPHGINHAYVDAEKIREVAGKLGLQPGELLEQKPDSSPVMPAMPGC